VLDESRDPSLHSTTLRLSKNGKEIWVLITSSAFHSGFHSVRCKHHSYDSPALRAVGKPIVPCRGRLKRSYSDHDTKKYGISGACGNGPGNDPVDRGSDRRCIRRCARFDSCDEIVDILHLCLRWPGCCGFPVRLSQSAALNVAEPSAPIRQRGMGETMGRVTF